MLFKKICNKCKKEFKTSNKFAKKICSDCMGVTIIKKQEINLFNCDQCGKEFVKSPYHPHINKCKQCRRGKKRINSRRRYTIISDEANVGLHASVNIVDKIKRAFEANEYVIEDKYAGMIRLFPETQTIGLGMGAYIIENDELKLVKNYREI